jgi:hypothetical protein
MAGTVTINQEYLGRQRNVVAKCVSDSSGDVSGTPFAVQGGNLYAFKFLPVSGVSDNWDMTVTAKYTYPDGTSIQWADILNGEGADLSNSTKGGWVYLSKPFPLMTSRSGEGMLLTPVISNLGNAQTVHVVFDIWEEFRG